MDGCGTSSSQDDDDDDGILPQHVSIYLSVSWLQLHHSNIVLLIPLLCSIYNNYINYKAAIDRSIRPSVSFFSFFLLLSPTPHKNKTNQRLVWSMHAPPVHRHDTRHTTMHAHHLASNIIQTNPNQLLLLLLL
jgi:hypothetical protein